jgi:hypothetical protein
MIIPRVQVMLARSSARSRSGYVLTREERLARMSWGGVISEEIAFTVGAGGASYIQWAKTHRPKWLLGATIQWNGNDATEFGSAHWRYGPIKSTGAAGWAGATVLFNHVLADAWLDVVFDVVVPDADWCLYGQFWNLFPVAHTYGGQVRYRELETWSDVAVPTDLGGRGL